MQTFTCYILAYGEPKTIQGKLIAERLITPIEAKTPDEALIKCAGLIKEFKKLNAGSLLFYFLATLNGEIVFRKDITRPS